MAQPRKTIPEDFYESENYCNFRYRVIIKEFRKLLEDIEIGGTLDGPLLTDGRKQYGQVEFTRASENGWITTFSNTSEGIVELEIFKTNKTFARFWGQSGRVIQTILLKSDVEASLKSTESVNLVVRILKDRVIERCQIADEISQLHLGQLQIKLQRTFASGDFADFTLLVSGEEIRAHKIILASGSRYFEAMFSSDMIETHINRLKIEDARPCVIRAMLEYMYTGQVRKPDFKDKNLDKLGNADFYSELFIAADKYQLDDLKVFCERVLCGLVNEKSRDGLTLLTGAYNLDELRRAIATFVLDQYDDRNTKKVKEVEKNQEVQENHVDIVGQEFVAYEDDGYR